MTPFVFFSGAAADFSAYHYLKHGCNMTLVIMGEYKKKGCAMASSPDQDFVLKTVKSRDVHFVRFWFCDVPLPHEVLRRYPERA